MTEFNSPHPDLSAALKVYSWNVLCYNRRIADVRKFIGELDFDILCLQEVTPDLLSYLQKLPYKIAYHTDVIRLFPRARKELNHVVILSKHPIKHRGTLQFPELMFPLRTRLFMAFMGAFNKWSFVTERGAVYADIKFADRTIRFFSVHLTLWGPHNRSAEFEIVSQHFSKDWPVIVAGDFNIIEFGPMKILNWLLGSSLPQGMPWHPERQLSEDRFASHKLKNPLRGMITHKFSHSQLDHILVPQEISIREAGVVPDAHGSDHHPITVTIEMKQG